MQTVPKDFDAENADNLEDVSLLLLILKYPTVSNREISNYQMMLGW
jgi:hypothetical protein